MEFFCLIETGDCRVPYLEYLPVDSLEEARVQVRRLMTEQHLPLLARIFSGNLWLDTLMPCGASTRKRGRWSARVPAGCGMVSGQCPFPTPRMARSRGGGCRSWPPLREALDGPAVRKPSRALPGIPAQP